MLADHIFHLRDQAQQCRKLACSTEHGPTAAMLEKMAAEYQAQADRLDRRVNPPPAWALPRSPERVSGS
jgi:hypothetical protein